MSPQFNVSTPRHSRSQPPRAATPGSLNPPPISKLGTNVDALYQILHSQLLPVCLRGVVKPIPSPGRVRFLGILPFFGDPPCLAGPNSPNRAYRTFPARNLLLRSLSYDLPDSHFWGMIFYSVPKLDDSLSHRLAQ